MRNFSDIQEILKEKVVSLNLVDKIFSLNVVQGNQLHLSTNLEDTTYYFLHFNTKFYNLKNFLKDLFAL